MENNLLSDVQFLNIKGHRALQLKNNYRGKNIKKDPIFKKWFKEEEGKNDLKYRFDEDPNILLFCTRCQTYIYDKTDKCPDSLKCCNKPCLRRVCLFCGQIFFTEDYCCLRNSLLYSFKEYLIDGRYFCSWFGKDCIKSVPIIFRYLFIKTIMKACFFKRQTKKDIFEAYGEKETFLFKIILKITFLIEILYIFVFYFPLTIAYLIYLYFYFHISLNRYSWFI